jgi:hypothetical protein
VLIGQLPRLTVAATGDRARIQRLTLAAEPAGLVPLVLSLTGASCGERRMLILGRDCRGIQADRGRLDGRMRTARLRAAGGDFAVAGRRALRLGPGDQVDVGAQVPGTYVNDVVALLSQGARNSPVTVGCDVDQDRPDPEVLNLGDNRRQILLAAHDDHVADRAVPGECREVLADLGLDALLAAWPGLAEPKLDAGNVRQRVMLVNPCAIGHSVVPVATQQWQTTALPGQTAEQLQEARVVPGNRVTIASAMDGNRAFG